MSLTGLASSIFLFALAALLSVNKKEIEGKNFPTVKQTKRLNTAVLGKVVQKKGESVRDNAEK